MKKWYLLAVVLAAGLCSTGLQSCVGDAKARSGTLTTTTDSSLQWHTMSQLEQLQKTAPRRVIVDVYTDWCRWCKVMDEQTFTDAELSSYLSENYYLVKLDAETKDKITYRGKTYSFVDAGKRGYHGLALELCQGSLSYPSFVVLDEDLEVLDVAKGFKKADQFQQFLQAI